MTTQKEILGDASYVPILDHGFVGLVDSMGTDASIVEAARTSYGKGTKSISEDRSLIRYLMRHKHTSVFEMVEFKFHLKMPIFIARQHIRHRTASVNEYSGRYSVMNDEFYVPADDRFQSQSKSNKQGSDAILIGEDLEFAKNSIECTNERSYDTYMKLLGNPDLNQPGLSRELARMVLPVNNYTEMYWKINLKNLLHYISLRADSHAQYEIQVIANAMGKFVKEKCPLAWEAFEDYMMYADSLSRIDIRTLNMLFEESNTFNISINDAYNKLNSSHDGKFLQTSGMSIRESNEFKKKWNFL